MSPELVLAWGQVVAVGVSGVGVAAVVGGGEAGVARLPLLVLVQLRAAVGGAGVQVADAGVAVVPAPLRLHHAQGGGGPVARGRPLQCHNIYDKLTCACSPVFSDGGFTLKTTHSLILLWTIFPGGLAPLVGGLRADGGEEGGLEVAEAALGPLVARPPVPDAGAPLVAALVELPAVQVEGDLACSKHGEGADSRAVNQISRYLVARSGLRMTAPTSTGPPGVSAHIS